MSNSEKGFPPGHQAVSVLWLWVLKPLLSEINIRDFKFTVLLYWENIRE